MTMTKSLVEHIEVQGKEQERGPEGLGQMFFLEKYLCGVISTATCGEFVASPTKQVKFVLLSLLDIFMAGYLTC